MIILEIAVAAPVFKTYSYELPTSVIEGFSGAMSDIVGRRVLVPFGRRKITGYILRFRSEKHPVAELKEIYDVLDDSPLFHKDLIDLFVWVQNYYHYPLGLVIQTALPGGLTVKEHKVIRICDKASIGPLTRLFAEVSSATWIKQLIDNDELSYTLSRKVINSPDQKRTLNKLIKSNLVCLVTRQSKERVKKKTEICYGLSDEISDLLKGEDHKNKKVNHPLIRCTRKKPLTKGESNTIYCARTFLDEFNVSLIPRKELIARYSYSTQTIPRLLEKKILESVQKRIFRTPFGDLLPYFEPVKNLTNEQSDAVGKIQGAVSLNRFKVFLLHGITGSGKTEVYLRAAGKTIAEGKTVLVLVPEIALATQIEAHFVSRFGEHIALLHSGLKPGERYDEWCRVCAGQRKIVIGARSAVFAPLQNVGLIIVDEEHDSSFKQEDQLRYNSRDLAIVRAQNSQAVVVLGSATPSVSSYYHTCSGKFERIELTSRVGTSQLPIIQLIDLKKKKKSMSSIFHKDFIHALQQTYEQGDQAILLMNRRGFSASVICKDCGSMVECLHCNVTLNLHKNRHRLLCHYCGYNLPEKIVCRTCGSDKLVPVGFGTERVEEEVKKILPTARIARLDSDIGGNRKLFLQTIQMVRDRKIDILVGTQMIAKGLHFPDVTMVGVVWADGGLSFPDYRAAEKTFQLIAQVTGRAGRGEKPGKVLIQTMQPEHYAISYASNHDYHRLVDRELEIRKEAEFPPFVRLVSVRIEGSSEKQVRSRAQEVAAETRLWCRNTENGNTIKILGPAPAPLEKLRDVYRWQILVKGRNISHIHLLLDEIGRRFKLAGKEKLVVDVDPENML